jgi:hypothetical protein
MRDHKEAGQYSEKETQQRFEAALRGARMVGHKPLKDIPKKNGESRTPATRTKQLKRERKR